MVWVHLVCPSCDREPPAGATAGASCAACATPLVQVGDDAELIGQVIDNRFEVIAALGKGGMGTVYRAKQRSIGREVALKILDRRFDHDVGAVKRFLREAKLASQLVHPNTVGVIEFGQSGDGRLYLVMELVRGRTLHDVVRAAGALPIARIVRIGVQLCDALEAAHALAIVHRDLKLENVMVLDGPPDRDAIKVLDFGLARSLVDPASRATATGIIAGTPRYLPPEVALDGADPAPAQDLYALGVILGELATGRALWDAPTIEALFAHKLQGTPALIGVAPALRAIVERLLAVRAELRPACADVRAALLAIDGRAAATDARAPATTEFAPGTPGTPLAPGPLGAVALAPTGALEPLSAVASAAPLASAAFAPPAPAEMPIQLDAEWEQQRAAKQHAARQVRRAPGPRPSLRGVALAVVVIGAAGGGLWYATTRRGASATAEPTAPAPRSSTELPATPGTVTIRVHTDPAATLHVDGRAAGKGTSRLRQARGTSPIVIEAILGDRHARATVVPDHDQTIELLP